MRRFPWQWRRLLSRRSDGDSKYTSKILTLDELASVLPAIPPEDGGGNARPPRTTPVIEAGHMQNQRYQEKQPTYFKSLLFGPPQRQSPQSEALKVLHKETETLPLPRERMPRISLLDNQCIPSRSIESPTKETRRIPKDPATASPPLSLVPKERLAHVPTTNAIKTFAEMRLPGWLLEALAARNIHQPTTVQQRLIEAMLEYDLRRRFIYVRAQTGTGKSLGYVIALLAGLHKERRLSLKSLSPLGEGTCSCLHLILVPNAILGLQLLRWIKTLVASNVYWSEHLSHIVKALLPTEVLDDDYPNEVTESHGNSYMLITTPGQAQVMLAQGRLSIAAMHNIIIDEADAQLQPLPEHAHRKRLLNRVRHPNPALTFLSQLYQSCNESRLTPPRPILASATLTRGCRLDLLRATGTKGAKYITIDQAKAEGVEDGGDASSLPACLSFSCPPTIKHYYRMLKDAESIEELLRLVQSIVHEHEGQLGALFVPASKSKAAICEMLRQMSIPRELIAKLGVQRLDSSTTGRLLVGSDVDARGWDMPSLAYVIIVDMPRSAAHYLHMAGRVGRMGNSGAVYTMVAGQKDLERLSGIYSMLRLQATPIMLQG